jgi:predicted nucleotidyltransferase
MRTPDTQHLASTACQAVSKSVSSKGERLLWEPGMGIADLLKFKRPEILRLAQAHGAHNVRIFGSVARGEARPESDVDFLVEMDSGRTLLDLIELSQDLETLLQCKVDILTDQGLSPYLEQRIHAEAVPL